MNAAEEPHAERRALRERIVREHMESENVHDFETTLATFTHPRYEIVPTGDVYDGAEEVSRYFAETRAAFPDQRNELITLHHADEAVIAEFWLRGTHQGSLRSLPATGRTFECRALAVFEFGSEQRIICERVYFDSATIMRQLGVAHDPLSLRGRLATAVNHPVTVGGALVRALRGR